MTMQVQGVGTQIGDLTRMLSCLLGSNKISESQPRPTVEMGSIELQIRNRQTVVSQTWLSANVPVTILASTYRSPLPSLIPPGNRSGVIRNITIEVKGSSTMGM